jgi:hypothetical protein
MGRGRAKAKQQKVARDLKYNTPNTDFSALQRELGHPSDPGYARPEADGDPQADDDYDDERWANTGG